MDTGAVFVVSFVTMDGFEVVFASGTNKGANVVPFSLITVGDDNDANGFGVLLVPFFFLLVFLSHGGVVLDSVALDDVPKFSRPVLTCRFGVGAQMVALGSIFLFVPTPGDDATVTSVVVMVVVVALGAGIICGIIITSSGERLVVETTGGKT